MNITTVKLRRRTKSALDVLREGDETYDEVISKLIAQSKYEHIREGLIEGYRTVGKEDLTLLKDWDHASADVDQ